MSSPKKGLEQGTTHVTGVSVSARMLTATLSAAFTSGSTIDVTVSKKWVKKFLSSSSARAWFAVGLYLDVNRDTRKKQAQTHSVRLLNSEIALIHAAASSGLWGDMSSPKEGLEWGTTHVTVSRMLMLFSKPGKAPTSGAANEKIVLRKLLSSSSARAWFC